MGALAFLFFCLAGYFWRVSAKRKKELEVQAKDLADYRKLTGVQETIASLNGDIVRMKTAVSKKKAEHDELLEQLSHAEKEKKAEHDKLLEQIRHAEKVLESFEQDAAGRQDVYETLQDTGFYAPLYDFGTAQEYKGELERIREQQKQLLTILAVKPLALAMGI
jgi:chromosome segregation ATPase